MNENKTVPRRSYKIPNTSTTNVPIIGLGCSSFTIDWYTQEEKEKITKTPQSDLSWITKDHPLVQKWVSTILHAVIKRGINIIDTAPWYGNGCSEIVLGYALSELFKRGIQRKDLIINTKVGRYSPEPSQMFDFSSQRVKESTILSLKRINCDYIDVLQLHDPEFTPSLDVLIRHTIPAMVELKESGIVKSIGITGYPLEFQRIIIIEAAKKGLYFDQSLTYCHYNLHDQSLFSTLDDKVSFADFCNENNMGLLCAAPFSMGLLTHAGPPSWHPAPPSLKQACKEAAELCKENNVDIGKLALLYALSNPKIACTMVGVSCIEQIDFSADVACLFHGYQASDVRGLDDVISECESSVLKKLLDTQNGKFSSVHANGDYQWDGLEIANEFWKMVPGGKIEAAKRMSD